VIPLTLEKIAEICNGKVLHADPGHITSQYPVIDSRSVTQDSFFVALSGEKVDGHNFAAEAITRGAEFVLATRDVGVPTVLVENCEKGITDLSIFLRNQLTHTQVIGITGSQGKTTTKDLAQFIFALDGETVATQSSYNNELGVPLTILRATANTRYLILEMGARHIGDIKTLCQIARPHIGAVLIVGNAHQEIFGSQEAIARAKSEMITSLSSEGTAVLGCFDPFTPRMADGLNLRTIHFGVESTTDEIQIRATDIELRDGMPHFDLVTPVGRESITLNFIGLHQVANALAAAALAYAAGISFEKICEGLSTAMPSSHLRMQVSEIGGILFINDSYNANPASMKAAISTLRHFSQGRGGESWAFIGKMHELGDFELEAHINIGEELVSEEIDHLVEIGDSGYSRGVKGKNQDLTVIHEAADFATAVEISQQIQSGDSVLFKASRAEHLEELASRIMDEVQVRDNDVDHNG